MYRPGYANPIPPMVGTHGLRFSAYKASAAAPGSATYESASRAVYYPVLIDATCVVRRVWWVNGATTTGGATIEAGIYADSGYGPGAKLVSGSATQGTASEVQFVDVTDTALAPGRYWLAIVSSATTSTTLYRSQTGAGVDATLRFEQASASPLPATATPVETTSTNVQMWLFGFATTASP